MVKSTKSLRTYTSSTPEWAKAAGPASNSLDGSYSRSLAKFVQGVAYVQKDNKLKIVIKYKTGNEYDPVSTVIDKKENNNLSITHSLGEVILTYKNWRNQKSSIRSLELVFGSGYIRTISLKVPGRKSKFHTDIDEISSVLSETPYQNFLALSLGGDSSGNQIVGAAYAKADPYNVFGYSGVFSYKLPYLYYITSADLNDIFVSQGVISNNANVEPGISSKGVGYLHAGIADQEIHFINVVTTNKFENNQELLNYADNVQFTYGFVFGKNLYNIDENSVQYHVCTNEGSSTYYRTTKKDCEGTTISGNYLNGTVPARFLDGGCCDSNCDSLSISVEDVSPKGRNLDRLDGQIKVTASGGDGTYTYNLSGGNVIAISSAPDSTTNSTTHTWGAVGYITSNEPPFKITVTDSTGCSTKAFIRLTKQGEDYIPIGCDDGNALNNNSFLGSVANTDGCYYCIDKGPRGETYKALGIGSAKETAQPIGVELIANSKTDVYNAKSSAHSDGKIVFQGELFPPAAWEVTNDSNVVYGMKLYSLGNGENANDKTKAEILALSATTTVTDASIGNQAYTYTFTSLASGWYAISCYTTNVPAADTCNSVYRFYVGYGGCTDSESTSYDRDASYHRQELCTYDCTQEVLSIAITPTDQPCLKHVRVPSFGNIKDEKVTWKIGTESKTGHGPHFAVEGDYVTVYVENTKTKCTQSAEVHIKEKGCKAKEGITKVIKSLWIQNALGAGGCMDPNSPNYDCDALWDDGTCLPVVPGCTNNQAINYDASANLDNGTCIFGTMGCTKPTALNYNPVATVPDNENCTYCPELSPPGQLNIGLNFNDANLGGPDYANSNFIALLEAGNWDPSQTYNVSFQISMLANPGYAPSFPAGIVLRLYKIPFHGGTFNGASINDFTFPLVESNVSPVATLKLTGLDSPLYNTATSDIFGNGWGVGNTSWNADGSLQWNGGMIFSCPFPTDAWEGGAVELQFGTYIMEFEIPWINPDTNMKTKCYHRTLTASHKGDASQAGIGSNPFNQMGDDDTEPWSWDVITHNDSSHLDAVGCGSKWSSTYLGYNSIPNPAWGWYFEEMNYTGQNASYNNVSPDFFVNGLQTINTSWDQETYSNNIDYPTTVGAMMGVQCEYDLTEPPCLPIRLDAKLKYISDCVRNGLGNWYNDMSTGKQSLCDKDLWVMLMIEYLTNQIGLSCIYNCADSGTGEYNPKTCEEQWADAGSKEFAVDSQLQGNGFYVLGDFVKMTTAFPTWQGDNPTNEIFIVKEPCGSNCGNPNGWGWRNWTICADPKIITENVNYLDNFFKFANDYCQSCNPCSFQVDNTVVFLPGGISTSAYYEYESETDDTGNVTITNETWTIGGIEIDVD